MKSLQKLFKSHPEFTLVSLVVLLFAILITFFFFGITELVVTLNKGINVGGGGEDVNVGFNIKGAQELDLKGVVR